LFSILFFLFIVDLLLPMVEILVDVGEKFLGRREDEGKELEVLEANETNESVRVLGHCRFGAICEHLWAQTFLPLDVTLMEHLLGDSFGPVDGHVPWFGHVRDI